MNNAATNDADFPALQSSPSTKHCSNCSAKMSLYTLPGHYDSKVEIDVCMDCNAIWFDQFENLSPRVALTSRATLHPPPAKA